MILSSMFKEYFFLLTAESIGNTMGITFDKDIFKNPLKSSESFTLDVKGNLRKKLASVFTNKDYFTIDDGKIYVVGIPFFCV